LISQVNSGFFAKLKLWPETWAVNTPYTVGDVVKNTGAYNSHSYKCTTAGTSAPAIEPVWGIINGGTTVDNTATWTCYDTKTYQIVAPQSSTVPYVTFGLETEAPMGTFDDFEAIENLTYWVNAFSDKSPADVAEIADEIMTALDDATLTVTGYTSMKCFREFIGSVIWDAEAGVYQIPLRYRLWLDKS
jgi:hypothetical protein